MTELPPFARHGLAAVEQFGAGYGVALWAMTGVLYAAVVAMWVAVIVPTYLKRHDRRELERSFASPLTDQLAVRRAGWTFGLSLAATAAFYGCYVAVAIAAATDSGLNVDPSS